MNVTAHGLTCLWRHLDPAVTFAARRRSQAAALNKNEQKKKKKKGLQFEETS